ncbi:hypothetical protein CE91St38_29330 [Desulfovibrionaceae bacterium]|nr:hypothetical protein CE91St38_29330 [Desulfovibrionaceae bacterium]GKI13460.1 hypothetical protein CE91St39_29140 [Desulfovibrionaceae bacterium]
MTTPEKRAEWWRWVRGECSPQSTMDYRDAIAELLSALESYQSLEVREKAELAARLITEVRIEQAEEHAAHLERAMGWLAKRVADVCPEDAPKMQEALDATKEATP